jgi:hypothetical protein
MAITSEHGLGGRESVASNIDSLTENYRGLSSAIKGDTRVIDVIDLENPGSFTTVYIKESDTEPLAGLPVEGRITLREVTDENIIESRLEKFGKELEANGVILYSLAKES